MASSIFRGGSELFDQSPTALRLMDNALQRWGRHLLGWPGSSPGAGVLCERGWPDAGHLALGRLLALGTHLFHVPGSCKPFLPVTQPPCVPIWASLSSFCHHIRRWVHSDVSASLDSELCRRVQGLIHHTHSRWWCVLCQLLSRPVVP